MNNDRHLVLHGLAIKKHADADAVAAITGLGAAAVQETIEAAVAAGRVTPAGARFMLTPAAQMALQAEYSRVYAPQRSDAAFLAAYQDFEDINLDLKAVITDWQTMSVGGEHIANDHSDPGYDARVIDRLGKVHERAEGVLDRLAAGVSRLGIYADNLLAALERAEDGDPAWVSDARRMSYHTVWFELHEDLLRITGRQRCE